MKTLRTIRNLALTLGLLFTGVAATANAQDLSANANPSIEHHVHYHVYYRVCAHDPWTFAGHYDCHEEAHFAVNRLRAQGYEAFVRH